MEWSRRKYNEYYNHYMPWVEDKYLQWYGENKASYMTKESLKTPVAPEGTGIDKVQSGLAEGVGGQFGKGGMLESVGNAASKEGVNRVERGEPQAESKTWTSTLTGGYFGSGEDKEEGKKEDKGKKDKK